ncbi:hypothetical protein GCM10010520_66720 [Rhizobium viscosum]|uniref:DUF2946 domain-containing protein n=1 Tax=Rhizobium viscosum TaxID=1673 RepID=A0ABR9IU22_RHIVS|nr:hypothetical protein [Rhizobium viscosum]
MGKMYLNALSRLLFFVRLVIIVSLAGYTLSNANAAMHGSAFPDLQPPAISAGGHDHHAISGEDHAAAGDHGVVRNASIKHDHGSSASDDGQFSKQQCCKDFCGGFGIVGQAHEIGGPVISSIRQFTDDQSILGELPPLHRPPKI